MGAKFSVLISVYESEMPEHFISAMKSVINQTVKPDEIILVRDGAVPAPLQAAIDSYAADTKLVTYVPLEEHQGLGNALRIGVDAARNELIARMDSDDICAPNRFELQFDYLDKHPEVSLLGGQIEEFEDNENNIVCKRSVPQDDADIRGYMKRRNPFNHMTVMFKKSDVIAAGHYQEICCVEDYYLWCRLMISGVKFANLPQTLVYARTGNDMYQRRSGLDYYRHSKQLEQFKLKNGITTRFYYITNLIMRYIIHVAMPGGVRGWFYKAFTREKVEK